MNFNNHSELEGTHAFLSASNYHWINYDLEKLADVYRSGMAASKGTRLHAFASEAIKLKRKQSEPVDALTTFVNDAIDYGMESEQILFYSENCYGTADAIQCEKQSKSRKKLLRIHDLKTGKIPGHMEQLLIYAALFCLEYHIKPVDLDIELRIYQDEDIKMLQPDAADIYPIMDKIVEFDQLIRQIKSEEGA